MSRSPVVLLVLSGVFACDAHTAKQHTGGECETEARPLAENEAVYEWRAPADLFAVAESRPGSVEWELDEELPGVLEFAEPQGDTTWPDVSAALFSVSVVPGSVVLQDPVAYPPPGSKTACVPWLEAEIDLELTIGETKLTRTAPAFCYNAAALEFGIELDPQSLAQFGVATTAKFDELYEAPYELSVHGTVSLDTPGYVIQVALIAQWRTDAENPAVHRHTFLQIVGPDQAPEGPSSGERSSEG